MDRFVGEDVGEEAFGFFVGAVDFEGGVFEPVAAAEESVEFFIAEAGGVESGSDAEMPFADEAGAVSVADEQLRPSDQIGG